MADYMFLFRGGDPAWETSSHDELQERMQKWMTWMKELGAKGHFKSGEPLGDAGKVVRGRSKTVIDGPFAEAKDVVGGYLLVQARDLDEAVELSKGCPLLESDLGTVEVRPITPVEAMG
jgi:hypothetical protein